MNGCLIWAILDLTQVPINEYPTIKGRVVRDKDVANTNVTMKYAHEVSLLVSYRRYVSI
jgi:hypothetical protein